MATIGNVVISVFASTDGLKKSLAKGQRSIKKFADNAVKTLKTIGKAVAAGVTGAIAASIAVVERYAAKIDKLAKTSSKLGTTVGDLQKLQYQAELTGVGADKLNQALQRSTRRISEAAAGYGEARGALKELGLDAQELAKLSPDQQFYRIAEAMKGIAGQGDKVRLAMKLFDSEGVDLVNTLNSNLEQTGAEFESLGIRISDTQAKLVESYNDSKTQLGALLSGFGIQLTAQLAEPFKLVIEWISKSIKEMGGFEVAANKVALTMVKAFKGVLTVVDKIVNSLNNIKIKVAEESLEGAASRYKTDKFLGLDTKDNVNEINRIIEKIKKLKSETNSLNGVDDLINRLESNIKGNAPGGKTDFSQGVQVFQGVQVANENLIASIVKSTDETKKAAEGAKNLANAANDAAKAIKPEQSKLEKLKASRQDLEGQSAFGILGVGKSAELKDGGLSGFFNGNKFDNEVAKTLTQQQDSGSIVTLNMNTDTSKISGKIFAEQSFLDQLKAEQIKNTNQEARLATI
jgi:hypothetical protein